MRSRDYRRAQRERIKHKRIRERYWGGHFHPMVIDTPHPCSCWGCGNQRRHFGEPTVQERRQPPIEAELEQAFIDEFFRL